MVNFRVVRLGDVLRNLVKVVILMGCIMIFARFFSGIKNVNFQQFVESRKREIEGKTFIECLEENLDDGTIKDKMDKSS